MTTNFELYAWRLVVRGEPLAWNEVAKEHFLHLQQNRFFGPGLRDSVFQGRVIKAAEADVTIIEE